MTGDAVWLSWTLDRKGDSLGPPPLPVGRGVLPDGSAAEAALFTGLEELSSLGILVGVDNDRDVLGGSRVIRLGLVSRGGDGTMTTACDFRAFGGSSEIRMHCKSSISQEINSLIKSSVALLQLGQGTRILVRRVAFQRLKHFYCGFEKKGCFSEMHAT